MQVLWVRKELCSAYGQKCNKCNRVNHFASECQKKTPENVKAKKVSRVHTLDEKNIFFSEKEWISIMKTGADSKVINCRMIVDGKDVTFQVEPDATANLLPLQYADSVKPDARVLKMCNDSQLSTVGTCRTSVRNPCNQKKYSVEFLVFEGNHTSIPGLKANEAIKIVKVQNENFESVTNIEFKQVFMGELGSLSGV